MAGLKGPHREVKAGCRQRASSRTWSPCLHQYFCMEYFEIPSKGGLGNSNKNQLDFGKLLEVLSKGYTRGRKKARRWENYLLPGTLGKSHQELAFTGNSASYYVGYVLQGIWEGLMSVQISCRPLGHKKEMLRQQYYGVLYLKSQQVGTPSKSQKLKCLGLMANAQ